MPTLSCLAVLIIFIQGDGIYDKLSNRDIVNCIWSCSNEEIYTENINEYSGRCVDSILKNALMNQTMDNITCIFICFENFKRSLYDGDTSSKLESIRNRILLIDNDSIKLKEDENNYYFDVSIVNNDHYNTDNKLVDFNLEPKDDICNESNDLVVSCSNKNDGKTNNLKLYKHFSNHPSKLKYNSNNINYTNQKVIKNKRLSEDHIKKRPLNDASYPSIDNNHSINDNKRHHNTSNNTDSKPQKTKSLKNSFHYFK